MKLVPYDEKKIGRIFKPCKNQKIIQEFLDSGENALKSRITLIETQDLVAAHWP